MTNEERAVADELLRQAGCEPAEDRTLRAWSNVLQPDYEWGMGIGQMLAQLGAFEEMRDQGRSRKSDFFRNALNDADRRVNADDRHMAAWVAEMGGLRGPEMETVFMDEVEPTEPYRTDALGWSDLGAGARRVENRKPKHEVFAISYAYPKVLDEPAPAPRRRRPAWLHEIRETWLGIRWAIVEWIEPK